MGHLCFVSASAIIFSSSLPSSYSFLLSAVNSFSSLSLFFFLFCGLFSFFFFEFFRFNQTDTIFLCSFFLCNSLIVLSDQFSLFCGLPQSRQPCCFISFSLGILACHVDPFVSGNVFSKLSHIIKSPVKLKRLQRLKTPPWSH